MKTQINTLLKLGVLTIGAVLTSGANAASDTATASAEIIAPIAISKSVDMNFGQIVSGAGASTIVLTPAGARSVGSGDATLGNATGVTAASFAVTGQGTNTYAITLPSSVTLDNNATGTMTADTFTSNPSGTGTLTAGAQTLTVGATLNVGASQESGSYSSDTPFTVTVEYN